MLKKNYATLNNWQISPSTNLNGQNTFTTNGQTHGVLYNRQGSPSPTSKIMYTRGKPAINPLLLQDMQKIRQNLRMY
jgi:hypothetical protein